MVLSFSFAHTKRHFERRHFEILLRPRNDEYQNTRASRVVHKGQYVDGAMH
jgi:hypothetical protein